MKILFLALTLLAAPVAATTTDYTGANTMDNNSFSGRLNTDAQQVAEGNKDCPKLSIANPPLASDDGIKRKAPQQDATIKDGKNNATP